MATNGTSTTTPYLQPLTGAQTLRKMLSSSPDAIVAAPGVYDGLTARLALAAGHEALYMTGAGTSLSRLGFADLGLVTQETMIANVAMISSLSPSTPVIADADTGYGGPVQVARTVAAYARAGCAALHIEDQVEQKRCGHLLGKQLVEAGVWFAKLRAAVRARDGVGSAMMVFARTDARQSGGFEVAMERCRGAVLEGGADGVFFEAIQDKEEAGRVMSEVKKLEKEVGRKVPVLLNVVAGGVTPEFSVEEARKLGFSVVIFPMACMDPVIEACGERLKSLKETGRGAQGPGVKRAFNLCALQECLEIDRLAGGKAYDTVGE
jgi:2-methylisocitrate lyase-like PEP mutase family enzyme